MPLTCSYFKLLIIVHVTTVKTKVIPRNKERLFNLATTNRHGEKMSSLDANNLSHLSWLY